MAKRWTDRDEEVAVALARHGCSPPNIGAILERTANAVAIRLGQLGVQVSARASALSRASSSDIARTLTRRGWFVRAPGWVAELSWMMQNYGGLIGPDGTGETCDPELPITLSPPVRPRADIASGVALW